VAIALSWPVLLPGPTYFRAYFFRRGFFGAGSSVDLACVGGRRIHRHAMHLSEPIPVFHDQGSLDEHTVKNQVIASRLKDSSTQHGAVLVDQRHRVVSQGFNGPPPQTHGTEVISASGD
jgi:hypothetical protein